MANIESPTSKFNEPVASLAPRRLGIPQFARVPSHAWIRPWADRCLIVGFVAVLLLPLIASLVREGPAGSLGENRRLASMPSLADQPYEKWPSLIDTYFRDNFGFRNT